MRKFFSFLLCPFCITALHAQIDAGLFRYPDVSKTQIVFSYANDLWVMPKEGGTAYRLSSPPGVESFPKFSPDGKSIAFSGNYDGNTDVYMLTVTGGIPQRLTAHGYSDRVVCWKPDGSRIIFASSRESGKARFNQFYAVAPKGGVEEKLPFPYAEFGSYSPDGKQMALIFRSQAFRNWKRYRGGWNADIHLFNFSNQKSENISAASDAADEFPMWHDNDIYFLSDRGKENRMNIWHYTISNKTFEQVTHFTDYDVHFPSMGPDDIVFEQGGKLYLLPFTSSKPKAVPVNLVMDETGIKPFTTTADRYMQHIRISPNGARVLVEARGDIFSVPAENGYVKNLTSTTGAAERNAAWSPDGRTMAYWCDASGEYELWTMEPDKEGSARKVSNYGAGFRYALFWSPDSKKLAFIDKAMQIKIWDKVSGQTYDVDKALRWTHGNLEGFTCSWSADSRWLAYSRDMDNSHNAVFLYDFTARKRTQATSGFYDCSNPVFDPEGKYLYVATTQSFQPTYSDYDNTFIYSNSVQLATISLQRGTPSLLAPKNDSVDIEQEEKAAVEKQAKPKKDTTGAIGPKTPVKPVVIDLDGLEQRMVLLPLPAGYYGNLSAAKGKIIYLKYPAPGIIEGKPSLKFYNIEKREEKTILDNVSTYELSAKENKILVQQNNAWAVIKNDEGQKFEKPLRLAEMQVPVDPKKEWKQLFLDAWRLERDYFYDPNMHGVNWNGVKERYGKMLEGAMTREEVDFILGEMLGELNASHTYHGGGDLQAARRQNVGYLGVDWQADGSYYKIKRVLHGAPWDAEVRSPLDVSGGTVKEGDYVLAVNGVKLTTDMEPFAAFVGLADKAVELTYNSTPSWTGARKQIVKAMPDEYRLRNLAWMETNRKRVDEATNGEVGYIYVPSTGRDGQNELIRQFSAQWDKKALVIDERFNDGGQIPDRFIEILNRSPLAFWAVRDGSTWPWPPNANFGPKVMLINGWSGSGGDAFPDYFRKKGLGPLIGARTWGGLIGISGVPDLVDGGSITVPTFRMYNPDGTWFKEGHGVDPDIPVDEDLSAMAKGVDPQLERAITEIKNLLKTKGFTRPETPKYENRNE